MISYPSFQVIMAPHEVLSLYDFRQGSFANMFTLVENNQQMIALATWDKVAIINLNGNSIFKPSIVNNNAPRPLIFGCGHFPRQIHLAFTTMEYDQFFKLPPHTPDFDCKNIYFAKTDKTIITALPHPDKLYCLCIDQDAFVPICELQPCDGLARQPSPLGPDQLHNGHITQTSHPAHGVG